MTDKRIRLDCPFCHTKPEFIQLNKYSKIYTEIKCPKCGCKFTCSSKQEAIDKWNTR